MKRNHRTLLQHIFGLFFLSTSVLYTLSIASALLLLLLLAFFILLSASGAWPPFYFFQFMYIRYPREQPKEKREERRKGDWCIWHLAFEIGGGLLLYNE